MIAVPMAVDQQLQQQSETDESQGQTQSDRSTAATAVGAEASGLSACDLAQEMDELDGQRLRTACKAAMGFFMGPRQTGQAFLKDYARRELYEIGLAAEVSETAEVTDTLMDKFIADVLPLFNSGQPASGPLRLSAQKRAVYLHRDLVKAREAEAHALQKLVDMLHSGSTSDAATDSPTSPVTAAGSQGSGSQSGSPHVFLTASHSPMGAGSPLARHTLGRPPMDETAASSSSAPAASPRSTAGLTDTSPRYFQSLRNAMTFVHMRTGSIPSTVEELASGMAANGATEAAAFYSSLSPLTQRIHNRALAHAKSRSADSDVPQSPPVSGPASSP